MSRVNDAKVGKARHKKVIKAAKGYYGRSKNTYKTALQSVEKAWQYAYRDRKVRKREFRKLWIIRINALARENGITYSQLVNGLAKAKVDVNRKMLADLAMHEPAVFQSYVEIAKKHI